MPRNQPTVSVLQAALLAGLAVAGATGVLAGLTASLRPDLAAVMRQTESATRCGDCAETSAGAEVPKALIAHRGVQPKIATSGSMLVARFGKDLSRCVAGPLDQALTGPGQGQAFAIVCQVEPRQDGPREAEAAVPKGGPRAPAPA